MDSLEIYAFISQSVDCLSPQQLENCMFLSSLSIKFQPIYISRRGERQCKFLTIADTFYDGSWEVFLLDLNYPCSLSPSFPTSYFKKRSDNGLTIKISSPSKKHLLSVPVCFNFSIFAIHQNMFCFCM